MAFLLPVLEGLGSGLLGNALGGTLGNGTAGNAENAAMNALNTQDETFQLGMYASEIQNQEQLQMQSEVFDQMMDERSENMREVDTLRNVDMAQRKMDDSITKKFIQSITEKWAARYHLCATNACLRGAAPLPRPGRALQLRPIRTSAPSNRRRSRRSGKPSTTKLPSAPRFFANMRSSKHSSWSISRMKTRSRKSGSRSSSVRPLSPHLSDGVYTAELKGAVNRRLLTCFQRFLETWPRSRNPLYGLPDPLVLPSPATMSLSLLLKPNPCGSHPCEHGVSVLNGEPPYVRGSAY